MLKRFRLRRAEPGAAARSVEEILAGVDHHRVQLFQVIGPEDGACVCNDWVGAAFQISKALPDYPVLPDVVADGLFHPGCRHSVRVLTAPDSRGPVTADITFRTRLAVDAMGQRRADGEPDGQTRFTRIYGWARRADRAGSPAISAVLCDAALDLLRREGIFGRSQPDIERILKARIATIRARD